MAVVEERIAANGARCRIMDDAYINASPAEIARRRANANRIAHQILTDWARRQAEAARSTEEHNGR